MKKEHIITIRDSDFIYYLTHIAIKDNYDVISFMDTHHEQALMLTEEQAKLFLPLVKSVEPKLRYSIKKIITLE